MKTNPIIAIVGAGAVGGYYGGRLAQHGADVHFLFRSDFELVKLNGLRIRSVDGDFTLSPEAMRIYNDARHMPPADLVIVTLKATSNRHLPDLINPLLHDQTTILTLQNGLGNEDELARTFGPQRIVGGMAFVCINRVAPGEIEHTDHGIIRIGEYQTTGPSERVKQIAALFNASRINCEILEDLRIGRWDKLVWNVPFNGLGAALNRDTAQLLKTDTGIALVRSLMAEVVAIAKAEGVMLPDSIIERKIENTRSMGAYRSSMQIDRQEGRPMEIETIFGAPLKRAQNAGVSTPRLEMLYRALLLVSDGTIDRLA